MYLFRHKVFTFIDCSFDHFNSLGTVHRMSAVRTEYVFDVSIATVYIYIYYYIYYFISLILFLHKENSYR